jgi:ABC-type multidrug transport system permease subunit
MALSQLPVSLLEATLLVVIIYPMVGFHAAPASFASFWGVVAACNLCFSAMFRLLAVVSPNATLAAGYGGITLLLLILTSGFAIVRDSIPIYWLWAFYSSPFAYALRALAINEFTSHQWSARVAGVPGASNLGQAALVSFDFPLERSWILIGIAFL